MLSLLAYHDFSLARCYATGLRLSVSSNQTCPGSAFFGDRIYQRVLRIRNPSHPRPQPHLLTTAPHTEDFCTSLTSLSKFKMPSNTAAWQVSPKRMPFEITPAPYTTPQDHEIVVKNGAVAINPVDWALQMMAIFPIDYPAILGTDLAG